MAFKKKPRESQPQRKFKCSFLDTLKKIYTPFENLLNYAYTIRDKVSENVFVMQQIANNSANQAMLGDFIKALDDAIMDNSEAHSNQMMQLLSNPDKAAGFAKVVFDLLKLAGYGSRIIGYPL